MSAGQARQARVGEPVVLDRLPRESHVAFDPPQFKVWEDYREGADSPWAAGWEPPEVPEDGTWVVQATFSEPGTYVLRCLAHDGGLAVYEDVTLAVGP